MEWVSVTICGVAHRVAKPVADAIGLHDGFSSDDESWLDRIIGANNQYIQARSERTSSFRGSRPIATEPPKFTVYSPTDQRFVEDFNNAVKQWKTASVHLSSTADQMSLPSFQAIVGMGLKAVPLIVNDLRMETSFLFLALRSITGVNPIPKSSIGKPSEMVGAWISWARENGYVVD